jgi:hypothetical protein
MKKQNTDQGRRSILKGLMGIPVIAVAGFQASAQAATMVDPNDPTAKALKYTTHSTVAGSSCSSCALFSGGTAASGPCAIFPGKEVVSTGWCASYAKRP